VLQGFPDGPSMALLHELGITHVFVHTTQMSPERLELIKILPELKLQETFGSIALYRVR